MLKVLICCGNGMGTSQMMATNLDTVMKKYDVPYSEYHDSVGNAESIVNQYDLLICSEYFRYVFEPLLNSTDLLTITNIFDINELDQKLGVYLKEKGLI